MNKKKEIRILSEQTATITRQKELLQEENAKKLKMVASSLRQDYQKTLDGANAFLQALSNEQVALMERMSDEIHSFNTKSKELRDIFQDMLGGDFA